MRAFIYILASVTVLFLWNPIDGARAQIQLPSIKNKLIELALDQISSPGSFEITAGSIEDLGELIWCRRRQGWACAIIPRPGQSGSM